jgi:hypothetical protein
VELADANGPQSVCAAGSYLWLVADKGESFCALKRSDGNKAWCADYNLAGRALFGQGRVYVVAFKIIYHDATISEEPARLYILNESDGSLIAQYMPGTEKTTALADLALS